MFSLKIFLILNSGLAGVTLGHSLVLPSAGLSGGQLLLPHQSAVFLHVAPG